MTLIVGGPVKPILDSAGQPATGMIVFTQASRISTGSGLITTTPVTAMVTNGVLTSLNVDQPFSMPASPEGTFVAVSEQFDGAQYDYVTQIPSDDTAYYEDLPNLSPDTSGGYPTYQNIIDAAADAVASAGEAAASATDAAAARDEILAVDPIPAAQKAAPSGVATLDAGSKVPIEQIPVLAGSYLTLVQAAKNPDLLITGAITRNGSDVITSAAVVWPDGTAGTFTTDTIDPSGAINGYHITYGSPVTKTFTQPTMTRNANGAVTALPGIVVT